MAKTIIVSNRLPVKLTKNENEGYQLSSSEGGLATGLGSIYKQGDNVWIGWAGHEVNNKDRRQPKHAQLKEENLIPVFLTQEEITQYYEGFSNNVLWSVFHYYASTYANYEQSNWE